MEDILTSGRHLLSLINGILDVAKIESGKMELSLRVFPLSIAIAEVCSAIIPLAVRKKIHLKQAISLELGEVTLDPQKFKQILYNLASNAIKFTSENGEVRISARPRGADQFELVVKDTGIGIKKEDMPRLFLEFEQLGSGGQFRGQNGTGLGLVITKRLVEMQGGSIHVESEWQQGSTFTVVLPKVCHRAEAKMLS